MQELYSIIYRLVTGEELSADSDNSHNSIKTASDSDTSSSSDQSSVSSSSISTSDTFSDGMIWFQLYPFKDNEQ
jgi:hypothetical protein